MAEETRRKPDINLWEVAYRKRFGLGPFYVGAAAAALAGLSAALTPWQAMVGFCLVALALLAWVHTRFPAGARRPRREKKAEKGKAPKAKNDRTLDMRRWYAFAVVLAVVGWMIFARFYFPELASWIVLINICGCLLFGIGWWSSRRQRSKVQMEATIEDFPEKMKRIGFPGIRLGKVTVGDTGHYGKLHWDAGVYDVDDVLAKRSKFNNVMAKLRGQLRFEPDGKSTNSVKYRVIEKDPHAKPQPYVVPDEVMRAADATVIGPREDGEIVAVHRFDPAKGARNVLAGGTIGSGKSSFTNVCVADDVLSDDVFAIGLDMKQVELTPWAPALGYCITSLPPAQRFIQALAQPGGLFETRGNILARRKARVWNTEIDGPVIDIIMDETKEVLGNGDLKTINAFATLATKGRAYGIRFVLASQYPTLESIGSSQVRQQVAIRLCFRMEDSDGESFVMPGNRVFAELIDDERPGTCYVKDGAKLNSMPVRVRYIDDELRNRIVALRAGHTAELDEESAAAIERFFPEFRNRPRPGQIPVQRDAEYDEPGTGPGTAGTENGTGADEQDEVIEVSEWEDVQGGDEPDVAAVLAARRDAMSPEEQAAYDAEVSRNKAKLAEEESRRMEEPEAREAILAALAEAWPEEVRAKTLIKLTGRSSSWFYQLSNALEEEQAIERGVFGHWRLAAPPPQLVTSQ